MRLSQGAKKHTTDGGYIHRIQAAMAAVGVSKSRRTNGRKAKSTTDNSGSREWDTERQLAYHLACQLKKRGDLDAIRNANLRFPYINEAGELVGVVLRWNIDGPGRKIIRPITINQNGKWQLGQLAKPYLLFNVPGVLANPSAVVYVVEGEKAAAALITRGITATTSPHGAKSASAANWAPLAGREVVIWPDNDDEGERYARDVSLLLSRLNPPAIVRIIRPAGLPPKGDAHDWISERRATAAEDVRAELSMITEAAAVLGTTGENTSPDSGEQMSADSPVLRLPQIKIGTDEYRVASEVISALRSDESLYVRGGMLVTIIDGTVDDSEKPEQVDKWLPPKRISQIKEPTARERITRYAELLKETDDGMVPVHPPRWLAPAILHRGEWAGLRTLMGLVSTPVLRADGSLLTTPGYDAATGLYLSSNLSISVPDRPTLDDCRKAKNRLLRLFVDFPISEQHHTAGILSAILTGFSRYAFSGPAPLFLIDANVMGSGKSLLADVVGLILTGNDLPRMTNPRDDEECRKRITSLAVRGDAIALIDNITETLGGAALDAALTATHWQDRLLGRSEMIDLPLMVTWLATGNNVQLTADTSRRVCHIRLDCHEERPELRDNFTFPDLREHVQRHRAELVADALTILRGFHVAGRPQQALPGWGSFEGWSAIVRQCVVWLGLPDPAAGRVELMERSDSQAVALRQMLESWEEADQWGEGITVSTLLEKAFRSIDDCRDLREAILELCGGTFDRPPSVRLIGNKLKHLRGRIVGGRMLDYRLNRTKTGVWTVRNDLPAAGSAGSEGSVSATNATRAESVF